MAADRYRLEASRRNNQFQCWRLGRALVSAQSTVPIGRTVWGTELEGPELVKSLQASYHNNLFGAPGGDSTYFLAHDDDGVSLHVVYIGDGSQPVQVGRALVIQAAKAQEDRSACLCPSLVAVGQGVPTQGAVQLLLLSTGYGDLHLIRAPAQATGAGGHSVEAFCLPTAAGPAFSLQAAHQQNPGVFMVAAWRLAPNVGSTGSRVACEVVLMHVTLDGAAQLQVQHTTVLQVGRRPPQQVLIDPEGLAVLVVAAPEDLALQQASGLALHAGLGMAGTPSASTAEAGASPAVVPGAGTGGLAGDDEDEDEMDAGLLQQAAARLAQYTTTEQAGPGAQGPSQPWADLYREAGPSGEGELENDPSVVVSCYLLPLQPPTPGKENELPPPSWRLSLEPHRVLTACRAPGGCASTILLGLADDVDCAVVEVTAATTPQVVHVSSIPALAYVAAGKPQRRHLLLAETGSGLAAVLVEQQRHCFVYQVVQQGSDTGVQQVVQLDCGEDERVVGAALLRRDGQHALLVLGEASLHVLDIAV